MDRIEVLKGPQGTTFGSSALSGVIRYITKQPDLETFGGYARFALSARENADIGENMDMALNIPIVQDKLAVRASGYFDNQPGFIKNPFVGGENNDDSKAARVKARWQISDAATLDLMGMFQDIDTDGPNFYDTNAFSLTPNAVLGPPLPKFTNANIVRAPFSDHMWATSGVFNYTFDIGTVTVAATGEDRRTIFNRDASQVLAGVFDLSAYEPGIRSLITQPKDRSLATVEARFASTFDGPVQILSGFYFQHEDRNFRSAILTANTAGLPDPSTGVLFGYDLLDRKLWTGIDEKALFNEVTWTVNDQLKLIGGFRVFRFDIASQPDVLVAFGGTPGSGLGDYSTSHETSAIGRLNATYNFTPDILTYVQVAQGYRPGGVNDQVAASLVHVDIPPGFSSDSLVNYEIGYKQTALDHHLTVDGALFYTDWSDLQISEQATNGTGQSFPYTGNAGGARVYGGELEIQAVPMNGLRLGFNVGYTNAKIDKTTPNGGQSGDKIPYVPEWSLDASADYTFPAIDTWDGFVGADASWQDTRKTDLPENTGTYFGLNAYWLVNARAGIENDMWNFSFIIRNLLNEDMVTDYFITSAGLAENGLIPTTPRTFMLQATAHF
jgi:outer membrane receptor protein involved in Fe transport